MTRGGGLPAIDPGVVPGDDAVIPVGCWNGTWTAAVFSNVKLEFTGVPIVVEDAPVDAPPPDVLLDDPVDQGDSDIVLDDPIVDSEPELFVPAAPKSIAEGRAQIKELMALAQQQSANPPDATLDDSAFLKGVSDEEGGYFCMTGCVTLMFVAEVPEATVELSLADWVF